MSFNKNIPQPTDRIAKSQQDLLNNNLQLNTSFDVNHYTFDDATSYNGMHKFCQLVEQVAAPVPIATTDSLYTKVVSLGELFFVRGGAGTPIQMTNGNPVISSNGYTFLPGQLLIQWGTSVAVGTGITVPFNTTFTNVYSVVCTGLTNNRFFGITNITNSNFDVTPSSGSSGAAVTWIAIGKKT